MCGQSVIQALVLSLVVTCIVYNVSIVCKCIYDNLHSAATTTAFRSAVLDTIFIPGKRRHDISASGQGLLNLFTTYFLQLLIEILLLKMVTIHAWQLMEY